MAEKDLLPLGYLFQQPPATGPDETERVIPYTYGYNRLYDPATALRQGTIFPELDDQWRQVAEQQDASGYSWRCGTFRSEDTTDA